jgi:two-component system CheB/CheR fusion protein
MTETPSPASPAIDFPVVGIGASAGGLEAVSEMLAELPSATGMAYVLVQHLDPEHGSLLSEILGKKSPIPVAEAKDGMLLETDHLYIIPPNAALTVGKGTLRLTPRADRSHAVGLVDRLFHSMAAESGRNAIGIVLSGTGSDGARGLQAIHEAGGIAFAQEPSSARFNGMPKNALETGCVDFSLPAAAIARKLASLRDHPYSRSEPSAKPAAEPESKSDEHPPEATAWARILRLLRGGSGMDFTHYKRSTMQRRVARRQALARIQELERYADFLQDTPGEQQALARDMLIGVTSFFRDPESFVGLAHTVFPALLEGRSPRDPLRIWVPGCASGEEAYSIAICLLEALGERASPLPIQIFGTDASETAIARAREGRYPEGIVGEVSAERLQRFFIKLDGHYEIAKSLRDMCVFAKHDVTRDPPFSRLDLVSCRNLLIYLSPALQRTVFGSMHYALKPQGFLMLGPAEAVGQSSDLFELVDKKHRIYARRAVRGGHPDEPFPGRDTVLPPPRGGAPAPAAAAAVDTDRMRREADRMLLARYAPACVLVDEELNVHQFRGQAAPFLEPAPGAASLNLQKLAPPSLLVALSPAIREARKGHAPVRRENVRVESRAGVRKVNFEVSPFQVPETDVQGYLVVFEETQPGRARPGLWQLIFGARAAKMAGTGAAAEIEQLRGELVATREFLQATIEEHEAAKEELKSANEEVLSSNEEYQITNEELETAKEELQSSNEELATTNDELRHRNEDLIEQKERATQARDFAEAIVDTVRAPLLVLDHQLHIVRANRSFYHTFRVTPADTEGRSLHELGNAQWNIPALHALLDQVLTKEAPIEGYEVRHIFPEIGERAMILNARRLAGSPHGADLILLGIEDATARLMAEEHQRAAERLRETNRVKNEFLAMVSHELRNPLAAIRAALEVMRREREGDAKLLRRLELMDRQVEQLVRLVDDLLDAARIAQSSFTMAAEPILLNHAIDRAIETSLQMINGRGQHFAVTLPPQPIRIRGDVLRLTQVFSNLLSNASKFTPDRGTIALSVEIDGAQAVVTVADEGSGIDPVLLSRVFDPFVQRPGPPVAGRAPSGMGIGLTLARSIVEQHGGTIEAQSGGAGKGSEITVRLPLAPGADVALPAPPPQREASLGAQGRRVLVVDDNVDAADSMRDLLKLSGCEVRTAYHGASALQTAAEFQPEVVLLDIGLPEIDGYEVLRRLRGLPGRQPLVAALTGYGHPAELARIRQAGFDHQLTKPADSKLLHSLIASLQQKEK